MCGRNGRGSECVHMRQCHVASQYLIVTLALTLTLQPEPTPCPHHDPNSPPGYSLTLTLTMQRSPLVRASVCACGWSEGVAQLRPGCDTCHYMPSMCGSQKGWCMCGKCGKGVAPCRFLHSPAQLCLYPRQFSLPCHPRCITPIIKLFKLQCITSHCALLPATLCIGPTCAHAVLGCLTSLYRS